MKKLFLKLFSVFSLGMLITMASFTQAHANLPPGIKKKIESAASVESDPEDFAKVIAKLAKENPDSVGEIIRAAITASKANKESVGLIVLAVGNALPDSLSLIVDNAIVTAPDALVEINNAGRDVSSAAKIFFAPVGNPLEFPGKGPVDSQGRAFGDSSDKPGRDVGGRPFVQRPPVTDADIRQ